MDSLCLKKLGNGSCTPNIVSNSMIAILYYSAFGNDKLGMMDIQNTDYLEDLSIHKLNTQRLRHCYILSCKFQTSIFLIDVKNTNRIIIQISAQ